MFHLLLITTQNLVIGKLIRDLVLRSCVFNVILPSKPLPLHVLLNHKSKVRKLFNEQEQRQWHRSGVFIVICEYISHYVLIFGSYSKWSVVTVFLQILLAGRLIRTYLMLTQMLLSCCKLLVKLLNYHHQFYYATAPISYFLLLMTTLLMWVENIEL